MDNFNPVVSENKLLQDKTTMLLEKNKLLQKEIFEVLQENKKLKNQIQQLQDLFGYEICKYFEKTNNIRKTTAYFYYENVNDCYEALVEYYGCSDPLQDADDYKECHKEIFGREYDDDDSDRE
jgi:DNA-binding transcriptional regulator WhiA